MRQLDPTTYRRELAEIARRNARAPMRTTKPTRHLFDRSVAECRKMLGYKESE